MARTASKGRSRRSSSSSKSSRSSGRRSRPASKGFSLESIYQSPTFTYVAGGVGFAALAGIAYRFADSYPRITIFFRENLDLVESKLAEFRGSSSTRDLDEARH